MMTLQVQIVRFVEEHQPPIVEAQFFDSIGRHHTFIEKVAIFTADWLDASSKYPHPGAIRCEVLSQWRDPQGRELARVTTEKPDEVESTAGASEFEVLSSQLVND